jgi:hypothetical protein
LPTARIWKWKVTVVTAVAATTVSTRDALAAGCGILTDATNSVKATVAADSLQIDQGHQQAI